MAFCDCPDDVKGLYWKLNENEDKECLRCGFIWEVSKKQKPWISPDLGESKPSNEHLSPDTRELIAATNRTTHAVRAFVLFLFYQLSALTIALLVYFFAGVVGNNNKDCSDLAREYGNCPPNSFLLLVAIVIWVVGVVYSSNVGWKEITKSEVK